MTTVNNFQFKNSDHMDNFLGEFNILSVSKIANLIVSTLKNSNQLSYQIFKKQMILNYTNYSRE